MRVVYASENRGRVGTITGPATQAGMDVVIDFGEGCLAEYRSWEVEDVELCLAHLQPEPCETCRAYIAAGL